METLTAWDDDAEASTAEPKAKLYASWRAANAVPAATHVSMGGKPYKTGDGDAFHAPQRPNSDHSRIKSRGFPC